MLRVFQYRENTTRSILLFLVLGSLCGLRAYDRKGSATRNLYIATNGADRYNDGSREHPWRTIRYAASLAQPGWVVHVGPGVYDVGPGIVNNNSGTASSRIVYIGDYDKTTRTWNTKIVSSGLGVWTTSANYIDIVGFDITSTNPSATWGIHTGGSYIRIEDNYVHDIYSDSPGAGIMIGGGGTVGTQVTGNVVARIGHTLGAGTDNQCIYTTESHTSILNNIVFDCHKYAIQVYSALPGGSTYNIIANNTILASFRGIVLGGENIGSGPPAVDYNTVTNNIVYGMSSFGFHVVGIFGPHNVTSNNLTYRNGENYSRTYIARTSEIVADPLFVAYTGAADGDYHLQPRSPAIGAGTSVGAPLVDFEAKPRRRTPCVGAYEFQQRFTR